MLKRYVVNGTVWRIETDALISRLTVYLQRPSISETFLREHFVFRPARQILPIILLGRNEWQSASRRVTVVGCLKNEINVSVPQNLVFILWHGRVDEGKENMANEWTSGGLLPLLQTSPGTWRYAQDHTQNNNSYIREKISILLELWCVFLFNIWNVRRSTVYHILCFYLARCLIPANSSYILLYIISILRTKPLVFVFEVQCGQIHSNVFPLILNQKLPPSPA